MNETSDYVKNKLQNKHIVVAWIVSHCESPWRKFYARNFKKNWLNMDTNWIYLENAVLNNVPEVK